MASTSLSLSGDRPARRSRLGQFRFASRKVGELSSVKTMTSSPVTVLTS
jgi:hypothetical protein